MSSLNLNVLARIKDGTGHSIFGASASPMYLACPGSLIPNILAVDDAGRDAAYGTVAHWITETWLRTGKPPLQQLGQKRLVESSEWFLIDIDEEMFQHAEECVDRCEWEPGEHLVEVHVDFSHLTPIPNQGGTLDFAALRPGRATVTDHKFGNSPENIVWAEENTQAMLYSIGLWRDPRWQHYGFKDFVLRINQPRLRHFDEWHTTANRLAEFEDYARERMALAWTLDAPRAPGPKQCRFCKVRASCAANAKMQEDMLSGVFTDETVQTVEDMADFKQRLDDDLIGFRLHFAQVWELSTAQMAAMLPFRGTAESWWKRMHTELLRRAVAGEEIPGRKLVESRSRRRFKSKAEAVERLLSLGLKTEQIIEESLVSPAEAEKLLRKVGIRAKDIPQTLQGVVMKPPGKATLAPLSDRREALVDMASVVFEDEDAQPVNSEDWED